jgi:hypothetical protein
MNLRLRSLAVAFGLALASIAGVRCATAGIFDAPGATGFSPRVPISALGIPSSWFDPARLHFSSVTSVGAGGFSGGTSALQVTSLSYQFAAPVSMSVSLGNAWGSTGVDGRSSFFLEGLNLLYHPSPSMQFQIQYRDVRSPLQLQSRDGFWGW